MLIGLYIYNSTPDHNGLEVFPEIFNLYTTKELLEMIGVAYFIFAILRFIKLYKEPIKRKRALSFNK